MAVGRIIKSVTLAAQFAGRTRKRKLKLKRIDITLVHCWGLWPIHICVAIDHFSRKVMAAAPLEGPNAGWTINALESAIV